MLTEEQFSYLAKKYMDMVFRLALHYTKSRSESDPSSGVLLLYLFMISRNMTSSAALRMLFIAPTQVI